MRRNPSIEAEERGYQRAARRLALCADAANATAAVFAEDVGVGARLPWGEMEEVLGGELAARGCDRPEDYLVAWAFLTLRVWESAVPDVAGLGEHRKLAAIRDSLTTPAPASLRAWAGRR